MKTVFGNLFSSSTERENEQKEVDEHVPVEELSSSKIALQGDLSAISIDVIFQLFNFASLTGELEIQSLDNQGSFFFKSGVLVFGFVDSNRNKIGKILFESGLITAEHLDECLQIHESGGQAQKIGQILIDRGHIEEKHLADSLRQQVREAFFEVMTWQEGSFSFRTDRVSVEEDVLLNERIDHLLLAGSLHFDNTQVP